MDAQRPAPTSSLFFDRALLPHGWAAGVRLTVRAGRIARIETDVTPQKGDVRQGCAVPGMPNLHTHAFQRAMAGLAERRGGSDDSFWTWREVMYRSLDRMTPAMLKAVAALAYVEMLESGFTRVGEFHYVHHDPDGRAYADPGETSAAIVSAAAESGIGLTLLPVLYSYGGFGSRPPGHGQRRFISDIDGFAVLLEAADRTTRDLPDACVGVAPHSLRAVSPEQLALVEQIARQRPIHIHVAEQVREVEECLAWSGRRPVEWLLDHADIDDRWCLVHATHMTPAETDALARSAATAGLCPLTAASLGDGLFPAEAYVAAGGAFGIGSDSNVRIDLAEELRLLEYGQRLVQRRRNVLASGANRSTGRSIFEAALNGGARALSVAAGLTVGAAADIVSLDLDHISLAGRADDALLDSFVFAAGKDAIDGVWRHGEQWVVKGRHRARGAIERAYVAALKKLTA